MIEKTFNLKDEIIDVLKLLRACSTEGFEGISIIDAWNNCRRPQSLLWFLSHLSNTSEYPKRVNILNFLVKEFTLLEDRPNLEFGIDKCLELLKMVRDVTNIESTILYEVDLIERDDRSNTKYLVEYLLRDISILLLRKDNDVYLYPADVYDVITTIIDLNKRSIIGYCEADALNRIRKEFYLPNTFTIEIDNNYDMFTLYPECEERAIFKLQVNYKGLLV